MKRVVPFLVILCLTTPVMAQHFSGTYAGEVFGTPATLTLEQDANAIRGVMDASGYRYELTAAAQGTTASGTLHDTQTGGAIPVELTPDGQGMTLVLVQEAPYGGQVSRTPLSFRRSTEGAPNATHTPPVPDASGGPPVSGAERNPALVGTWVYQDTYVSGDFSGTTRFVLRIHPDGTYTYGEGQVTMGGSTPYGSYSGNSGGGDVTTGRWRTQGNIVYIQEPGVSQWQPYARYYVEGNRMLFTFGDGSRQLWHRQ